MTASPSRMSSTRSSITPAIEPGYHPEHKGPILLAEIVPGSDALGYAGIPAGPIGRDGLVDTRRIGLCAGDLGGDDEICRIAAERASQLPQQADARLRDFPALDL